MHNARKPLFGKSQGELNHVRDKRPDLQRWCQRQILGLRTERKDAPLCSSRPWGNDRNPPRWWVVLARWAGQRRVRRRRLFSRYPAGESQRLLPRLSAALGAKPPDAADFNKRRGPWALFLGLTRPISRSSDWPKATLAGSRWRIAAAVPFPRRPRPAGPAAPAVPARRKPTPAEPAAAFTNMALTVREKKPFLGLQIPSCEGDRLGDGGRHGRGNPSSTDALFIRRFSIPRRAGGERFAHPRPPPRPPSWGATTALPTFNPDVLGWCFTWQTAASLLRTKPWELYSDTRELARQEAHAERLPAAGDKKVAGWRLRHRKRWTRCSFLAWKKDWSLRPGWYAAESVWSEPKKPRKRTSTHKHHARRWILTSPAFFFSRLYHYIPGILSTN